MNYLEKQYSNKFNEKQNEIFNNSNFSQKKINNCMAVFSRLVKYSKDTSDGVVTILAKDIFVLLERYKKAKKEPCIKYNYFKVIIKDLHNLGLINVEKVGKIQKITVIDLYKNKEVNPVKNQKIAYKIAYEKPIESIETAGFNKGSKTHNYININTNTLIYNKEQKFVDEIMPLAQVSNKIMELCSTVNIKSKKEKEKIKNIIIDRLKKYNIQVRQSGCDVYLLTCIHDKIRFLKDLSKRYNNNFNNNSQSSSSQTFEEYGIESFSFS